MGAAGEHRITAVAFDENQRRLVTASSDGAVKMWNFNNGALLREYQHDSEQVELSTVVFAQDTVRGLRVVLASGWHARIFQWPDNDDDVVGDPKCFEGHREARFFVFEPFTVLNT